jgi:hypothetical protein
MGDDEKWAMQLQRPSVQATNRQQVFKPEHDDNLPSVKMVHLSEAQAEWSTQKYHDMYQEFLHTYNTLHQCGKNQERERERERERESLTSTPHSFLAIRFRVFRIKGLSPCQAPEAK